MGIGGIRLAIFRDYDNSGRDRSAEDRRRHRQLVEKSSRKTWVILL
jgi:hypothetical protein